MHTFLPKDNGILLAWNVGCMEGIRLGPLSFKPLINDRDDNNCCSAHPSVVGPL